MLVDCTVVLPLENFEVVVEREVIATLASAVVVEIMVVALTETELHSCLLNMQANY